MSVTAAGVLFRAPDNTALFVRRGPASDHPGEWAFPGGHIEAGETPQQAASREAREEIGHDVPLDSLQDLGLSNGFNTYLYSVTQKVTPVLNEEHTEWVWAALSSPPTPLHPGVAETVGRVLPDSLGLVEYEVRDIKTCDRGFYAPGSAGKTRRLTPEGYLICEDVGLARTGTQIYMQSDLPGIPAGPDGRIIVTRAPEEVFHPDTIASFEGKPVTLFHPREFVTPENWRQVAVGHIQNVRRGSGTDNDLLKGDIVITDAAAVQYAVANLPDMSSGYDAQYRCQGPGRASCHTIRGNHEALVPSGRAGDRCGIKDHQTEDFSHMSKTTVAAAISSWFKGKGMPDAAAVELQNIVVPMSTTDDSGESTKDSGNKQVMDAIGALSTDVKSVRDWQTSYDAACAAEAAKKTSDAAAAEAQKVKDAETAAAKKKEDAETNDTLIEAEEIGTVISLGKVWNGKTGDAIMTEIRATAEIISPGVASSMPTTDAMKGSKGAPLTKFMQATLERLYTKDAAGKDIVEPFLLGHKISELRGIPLIGAFNGVGQLVRLRNNNTIPRMISMGGTIRTSDGGKPPMSPAAYAENLKACRAKMASGGAG